MKDIGKVVQIIGAVVDVEFEENKVPDIYDALIIDVDRNGQNERVVLEVQQQLGDGRVRTVAMSATDGISRGMDVENTGKPIEVPVGTEVLGRILNVTGDAIDGMGEIKTEKKYPIHRKSPTLLDQDTSSEITSPKISAKQIFSRELFKETYVLNNIIITMIFDICSKN